MRKGRSVSAAAFTLALFSAFMRGTTQRGQSPRNWCGHRHRPSYARCLRHPLTPAPLCKTHKKYENPRKFPYFFLHIHSLTDEAEEQLLELSTENQDKILEAIRAFELVGTSYKNINDLGDGLFEIKPKGVRAYFMYDPTRRRIIIVGLIVLKKTDKAPKRFIKQARVNIDKYLRE